MKTAQDGLMFSSVPSKMNVSAPLPIAEIRKFTLNRGKFDMRKITMRKIDIRKIGMKKIDMSKIDKRKITMNLTNKENTTYNYV